MTVAQLMGQSAILTFLGMAVVFSFLSIVVLAVQVTAAVVRATGIDSRTPPAAGADTLLEAKRRAAISAAVHEHIRRRDSF